MLDLWGIINFTPAEVMNGNDEIPDGVIDNIKVTLQLLQAIRDDVGAVDIHSTYRSPERNKQCGGKPDSLHLAFNAIDFCPLGFRPGDLQELYREIVAGKFRSVVSPKQMGIGLYPNFIHVDTRGLLGRKAPARW